MTDENGLSGEVSRTWRDDPEHPGMQRLWDGTAWADEWRPRPAVPESPAEFAAPPSPEPGEIAIEKAPSESVRTTAAAGWYPDSTRPGEDRYWDGIAWQQQWRPSASGSIGAFSTTTKTPEQRRQILAQQVAFAAAQGKRVESQSEYQAVLIAGKPVNNVLHGVLTLLLCGVWGIVWIILAVQGGETRELVAIDEYGNVTLQRLGKK